MGKSTEYYVGVELRGCPVGGNRRLPVDMFIGVYSLDPSITTERVLREYFGPRWKQSWAKLKSDNIPVELVTVGEDRRGCRIADVVSDLVICKVNLRRGTMDLVSDHGVKFPDITIDPRRLHHESRGSYAIVYPKLVPVTYRWI